MQNILYSFNFNYESYLLSITSLASIVFGIYTIISKNPIVSVLFLIGLFLSVALYLIISGLQFIGLSYLIVYIGAISILFIFILMLINIRVSELFTETSNSLILAILIILIFNLSIKNLIPSDFVKTATIHLYDLYSHTEDYSLNVVTTIWETSLTNVMHISSIGNILYSVYSILFFLLALILLLAMVGSIIISTNSLPNNHDFIT